MRRQRTRTYLASFGYGVAIASVTAGSLVGVHMLIAPPAPDSDGAEAVNQQARIAGVDQRQTPAPGIERWAKPTQAPEAVVKAPSAPTLVSRPAPVSSGEAHRSLTRGIQRELARVGCFAGEVDGEWTATTRAAMTTFNETIRVQLPVTGPDYILLTLLQGHTTRACGSDPAIHAKAPAPRPAPRVTSPARPEPAPVAIVEVPRPAPVAVAQPKSTSMPKPEFPTAVAADQAQPAPSQIPTAAFAPVAPLPGRMAVGAPPALVEPPRAAEPARLTPPRIVTPPQPAVRPARSTPVAAPAPAPRRDAPRYGNPTRTIFNDMSRNAP